MVRVSTLFYVLDDTERNSEAIFDLETMEGEEEDPNDVSYYLGTLNLEVDQHIIDELLKTLSLI